MQSETEPYVVTVTDIRAAIEWTEKNLQQAREDLQKLADREVALPPDADDHDRDALRRRIGWARLTVKEQKTILTSQHHILAGLTEPA